MKKEESLKKVEYQVAAFYKFLSLLDEDIVFIKEELSELAKNKEIKGTTLIASEGINGTDRIGIFRSFRICKSQAFE